MNFTCAAFFLMVAVTFVLYWAMLGLWARNALIVVVSYLFYAWWDWRFCGLMLLTSLVDFFAARAIERWRGKTGTVLLSLSVGLNLGILGYFKYANFFIDSFQALVSPVWGHTSPLVLQVVLPAGISFYTFQALSYMVDVYRRQIPATNNLVDYLAYVAFFPQLVAGPIDRAGNLLPQIASFRRFDYALAVEGCQQVLWGLAKKVLLADRLAVIVDRYYGVPVAWLSGPQFWFGTVGFAFQIYCDFSAYSDIALGTSKLFGIRLRPNFASPYFSQSLLEFWRRWHISLSTWFRDYVYVPLGGSRRGRFRQGVNVFAVFLLSGLWHGASWNFVAWGVFHGLAASCAIWFLPSLGRPEHSQVPGGERWLPSWGGALRMLLVFLFVLCGWVVFRAASVPDALQILRLMFTQLHWTAEFARVFDQVRELPGNGHLTLGMVVVLVVVEWCTRRSVHPLALAGWPRPVRWAAYLMLVWGLFWFAPSRAENFIYFQF